MPGAFPPAPRVRVGTWNTEWAKPKSPKAERIRPILAAPDCDILCVTEGYADILPDGGHTIDAGDDWGYPIVEGRRQVLLWSKQPWNNVDLGPASMPGGQFVAGTTQTPIGCMTAVGVCIPWHDAHVRTGQKNRERWDEHLEWLAAFERLKYATAASRTIVLGDFNQRVPRNWTPHRVYASLRKAFDALKIATCGELPWANNDGRGAGASNADPNLWQAQLKAIGRSKLQDQLIDHIAHSADLALAGREHRQESGTVVGVFPRRTPAKPLSDHFGVWADLTGERQPSRFSTRSARAPARELSSSPRPTSRQLPPSSLHPCVLVRTRACLSQDNGRPKRSA